MEETAVVVRRFPGVRFGCFIHVDEDNFIYHVNKGGK